MKALARLSLIAALLAIPAVALAASGSGRVLAPECSKAVYKPYQLLLGCDGSDYLTGLHWQAWTRRSATGTAINKVDDCTPDCARGHFHAYPVAVTLSRPKRCAKVKRHKVFGHIVLVYSGAHPGLSSRTSGPLYCPF
jgi:hypothetical protein